MLRKLTWIAVLAGMVISVAGSILVNENMKLAGIVILLVIATLAGYRFFKLSVLTPTSNIIGTCIGLKRYPTYYDLSFQTSAGVYNGQARPQICNELKIGDRVKLVIKGPVILELNK
ncbi:MAG: hypothetical protein PHP51_08515 [Desulfotomaculaceae bacterium]|nr:hypothetical protein [Desulfotomaculaceae bacterium]MDD4766688.1 hypothetical protein [Desulfotomaculaceae bacterium]